MHLLSVHQVLSANSGAWRHTMEVKPLTQLAKPQTLQLAEA